MIRWPFTNLHELNLDWIIRKMKELESNITAFAGKVTATAVTGAPGSSAAVSVTGSLDDGTDFIFTIPRGAQGPQGERGEKGYGGAIWAECSTNPTVQAKEAYTADYSTDPYTPVSGDVFIIQFINANSNTNPTLSIDGGTSYPVYGFNGTTDPGVTCSSDFRMLLYFDGSAFMLVGPRTSEAQPRYRLGGFLSNDDAGMLNFSVQDIAYGTTTQYIYLDKTVADPYFIIQVWVYTGMTWRLMDATEYTIDGNVENTGSTTFGITFNSALTYPAKVTVFGDAIIGSGM